LGSAEPQESRQAVLQAVSGRRPFGLVQAVALGSLTSENGTFTLWLFNIAMENGPFIDGLPITDGDFPWLC